MLVNQVIVARQVMGRGEEEVWLAKVVLLYNVDETSLLAALRVNTFYMFFSDI